MHKVSRTIPRRRKEGKTDYKLRLGLLKSGQARIVYRRTNRYIVGQIVNSEIAQDSIVVGVSSKDLLKLGWPKENAGSLKGLQASYLTGYLLGKKAKIDKAIFDIGLQRNIHKSRLYAFLKGVIDAGVEIPHKEETLPTDEDLKKNEKLAKVLDKVKGEIK